MITGEDFPMTLTIGEEEGLFIPTYLTDGMVDALEAWLRDNVPVRAYRRLWALLDVEVGDANSSP